MKILCLINNLSSGGAQRQLVMLAKLLRQRGHNVSFVTYHAADFFAAQLRESEIPIQCIEEPRALPRVVKIRKALRHGDQDVVLSFLDIPNFLSELAALPNRRWGLVVSERSANIAGMCSWRGRFLRQWHRIADAVVTNSAATRQILVARFPYLRKKLWTIYNAVDLDLFSPAWGETPRREGRTTILVAASYRRLKNLHGLIQAAALLNPAERARLRIEWYGSLTTRHGNTDAYEEARRAVAAGGLGDCIALHAAVPNIHAYMRDADVVGLFSLYEGLPNAICEGMACGKPIIMSEVSDAQVLVEPKVNGFLCDPRDPASIAEALRAVIGLSPVSRLTMGRQSRLKAELLFHPDRILDQYLAVLQAARAAHESMA